METRIKYIKKKNSWYYAVQVKKWIFWKTLKLCSTWLDVEKFFDFLEKVEEYNNKNNNPKPTNKVVYTGYGVRDIISNGSPDWKLGFFTTYPKKTKRGSSGGVDWVDSCGHAILPLISINLPKLFSKECLEPMKLRITIEQMEE